MNRWWWLVAFIAWGSIGEAELFGQVHHVRFLKQECSGNSCRLVEESGSGVCLGELENGEWLVVTVAHGTEHAKRVDVALPDEQGRGRWQVSKVLTSVHDEERDLSLLAVKSTVKLKTYMLHAGGCESGAEVQLAGFPGGGFRRWNSQLRSENTVIGLNQQGESGGAVLCGGELIGVQWGHSPSEQATYFTPVRHVRTLVKQHVRFKGSQQIGNVVGPQDIKVDRCLVCEKCQQLEQELLELKRRQVEAELRSRELEQRVVKLEPLLKRRVILETEKGEVTADREYGPEEAIRLRSVYRSQSTVNGKNSNDK